MENKGNRKLNILYIHGYGGSENSSTAKELKNQLGDEYNVIAHSFSNDLGDFNNLLKNIETAKKIIKDKHIDIVVASSMGAFTAMNLTDIYKILINPCMRPSDRLPLTLLGIYDEQEIKKYANLEKTLQIDEEDKKRTFALFADNDELFSFRKLFSEKYKNENAFRMDGGHKIQAQNVKGKVIPLIKKIEQGTKNDIPR